jgi:hypothetical protein
MAIKIPTWIKILPAGSYTISDLRRISGVNCRHSIKHVMLKHGAKIVKERDCNRNIFLWSGFGCLDNVTIYVEENGKTFLYQKVTDEKVLGKETHLMSTSEGWFKRMFEVEKIYIEKKVG